MDTHTTILKVVIISDEILDLFNFPCFSIFSDLSAANMFSCEMQVGEESTCQPAEKHQNESAADPARRQLPRPRGGNPSAKNQIPAGETLQAPWRRLATGVRQRRRTGHVF